MTTERFLSDLDRAWRPARVLGALGGASIAELCNHAAGFIPAAFCVDSEAKCVDIGTGVGVPGILLAQLLPRSSWVLLDTNERRCEIARQAVNAVGLADRVDVIHGRADDYGHLTGHRQTYDLVVSRLFGQISETAECGLPLVCPGGSLVVSCSRDALRAWTKSDFTTLGGRFAGSWRTSEGTFVSVVGVDGLEGRYPRRPAARGRSPYIDCST